jgi:hypothetical protein
VHAVWFVQNLQKMGRSAALYDETIPVRPVPWISSRFVRDADAVVATSSPTAQSVSRLRPSKGKKFYLVQGFESWYQKNASLLSSYRLPLDIIAVSPWLSRLIEKECGRTASAELWNGLRHDRFFPPPDKSYARPSVLMMYSPVRLKGAQEGVVALERLKKEFPGVAVTLFGLQEKPALPFACTYLRDPPHDSLLAAYQAATIFLFPSHGEGWGLPAMEAMACGCALVATRSGAVDALYNGRNMLLIRPKSSGSVYRALKLLVLSEERRKRLGEEGARAVDALSWERSAQRFAAVLSGGGPAGRA